MKRYNCKNVEFNQTSFDDVDVVNVLAVFALEFVAENVSAAAVVVVDAYC